MIFWHPVAKSNLIQTGLYTSILVILWVFFSKILVSLLLCKSFYPTHLHLWWLFVIQYNVEITELSIIRFHWDIILKRIAFVCHVLDINECQSQGVCANGQCINYAGGYECSCDPGFEPNSDMRYCVGEFIRRSLF